MIRPIVIFSAITFLVSSATAFPLVINPAAPINEELLNIRVGVARTPQQAIPLFGSYWGDAEDELGMEVEVYVKTDGDSTARSAAAG